MSKEYYVTKENSDFFVNRPNGCLLTCAANEENAKYICAELNLLLSRIPAREEAKMELFPPITLEDAIKNTENAPKYDPCRLFRKGDKVRVVDEKNGRTPPCCGDIEAGELYTVSDDEDGGDVMLAVNGKYDCIKWYWLELVTPVEELEPYVVRFTKFYGAEEYHVEQKNNTLALVAVFGHRHPHPKEAAEAECARLNAQYRKEMEQ